MRSGDDVLSNVNPSWYWRKPGGGPLYDMTVYALHTLTGVLGPARRVTAMSGVRIPGGSGAARSTRWTRTTTRGS